MIDYHLHVGLSLCCDTPKAAIAKINTQLKKIGKFGRIYGEYENCMVCITLLQKDEYQVVLDTIAKVQSKCGCSILYGDACSKSDWILYENDDTVTQRFRNYHDDRTPGDAFSKKWYPTWSPETKWALKEEKETI